MIHELAFAAESGLENLSENRPDGWIRHIEVQQLLELPRRIVVVRIEVLEVKVLRRFDAQPRMLLDRAPERGAERLGFEPGLEQVHAMHVEEAPLGNRRRV